MIQILSIAFGVISLFVTIYVVRRRELHFAYATLWIVLSVLVLLAALGVPLWNRMAHLLGVYYAPAFMFLVAILFVMGYLFRLTITVTRLSNENVRLAQEVAMLKSSVGTPSEERESVAVHIARDNVDGVPDKHPAKLASTH